MVFWILRKGRIDVSLPYDTREIGSRVPRQPWGKGLILNNISSALNTGYWGDNETKALHIWRIDPQFYVINSWLKYHWLFQQTLFRYHHYIMLSPYCKDETDTQSLVLHAHWSLHSFRHYKINPKVQDWKYRQFPGSWHLQFFFCLSNST